MLFSEKWDDKNTLKVNSFTWVVNDCFHKTQDRLGTEKEAVP